MTDSPARPIFATQEQRDLIERAAFLFYDDDDRRDGELLFQLLHAWDAAPADATEAVFDDVYAILSPEERWLTPRVVAAVLAALGAPS